MNNSLKQLMAEYLVALARASVMCFNETVLHIAAMLGRLDLATGSIKSTQAHSMIS